MKFEDAAKYWAAKKLRAEWPIEVVQVDFDMRYEEGCPTCGGDTYLDVTIHYIDITAKSQRKKHRKFKHLTGYDLSVLLTELFEETETE